MTNYRVFLEADVSIRSAQIGANARPLNVPFEDNAQAQSLGARFHKAGGYWYIPPQLDEQPFWRWLSRDNAVRVQHTTFSVGGGEIRCHKCNHATEVFALFLPSGFKYRNPGTVAGWKISKTGALFSSVTDLQPDVSHQVRAVATGYRPDTSIAKGLAYWMNHCNACGTRIGDHYLHSKEGGPFIGKYEIGNTTVPVMYTHHQFIEFKAEISFSGEVGFYDFLEENHFAPDADTD